jgi:hypothetical protein
MGMWSRLFGKSEARSSAPERAETRGTCAWCGGTATKTERAGRWDLPVCGATNCSSAIREYRSNPMVMLSGGNIAGAAPAPLVPYMNRLNGAIRQAKQE